MKLLVVTNDFPPRVGGIQTYVHEILVRLDHDVTVMASMSPGAAEWDRRCPYDVVRLPTTVMLPTPGVRRKLDGEIRRVRPDAVLFGASLPLALLGPGIVHRHHIPYVAFTHGLELSASRLPVGRAMLRHIGRHAALVTAVSQWMAVRLSPLMGRGTDLPVLPSGVDTARFHPGVSDAAIRDRHALQVTIVVACVSRLVPRKGQDQLIRAVAALAPEHATLRLLVVGGGPYERRLRRLAQSLGVAQRVFFTGEVPEADLPAYFRCGDIFAMPCRSRLLGLEIEALGAVFLQAAAVGRPVIAGLSGGAAEAIVENDTGLLVDGHDLPALTRAIKTLLCDPSRAGAMGTRGASRIAASFAWDQIAARFSAMLASAVTPR